MSTVPDYEIPFATFHNIINNQLSDTETSRRNVSPSTEEPLRDVPVSTQDDVGRAVSAAQTAFSSWGKLSYDERAAYLNKFAVAVEANKEELTKLIGQELGKTPQFAASELYAVAALASEVPKLRLEEESLIDDADVWLISMPIVQSNDFQANAADPAYCYCAQVFPPGAFQALSGDDSLGPLLTTHPGVSKASFTSSVETGKKVMAACAATLKRVTLQLGGNDAATVCDDVDIDSVAAKICMSVNRIYVHENIYDQFLATIVAITKQFKAGDHTDAEAFFGPIQNSIQYEKLQKLYLLIEQEGWKVALGGFGSKGGTGLYMPATIIDNPPDDSRIVTDEPFGPIVPVLKWKDDNDVIKRANAPSHGLGASVWSQDVARARRIGDQLEAGSIWVNTHFELAPNVPFGGHKQSGLGTEWGEEGSKGWCNTQAYWIKH